MNSAQLELAGAGLGLRRALLGPFQNHGDLDPVAFMEVAPENWMTLGGRSARQLREYAEKYPIVLHGLSLSIGGPDPLNETFIRAVRQFKRAINAPLYSEHLSYCTDGGQLYDLMPIPFTEAAVRHVVDRILKTQDILGERIAMENVSYYLTHPDSEMSEIEFLNAVIRQADCLLHLDVNNIYVNSINHRYDPIEYLQQIPADKLVYIHIAGHYNEAEDLIVDTHGAEVIESVWDILEQTYALHGVHPTLLERDFNFPAVAELLAEVSRIDRLQQRFARAQTQLQRA